MLMIVQSLAVMAILVLGSVAAFRLIARARARRRRSRRLAASNAGAGAPPATVPSAPIPAAPKAVAAPEPVARAIPVHGLPSGRDAARALEGKLRQLAGVTAVYVSPVTGLVYLDYLPAQVREEALVQAIERDGYHVGDASHRFDWRHVRRE
jgi:hypothetical protein